MPTRLEAIAPRLEALAIRSRWTQHSMFLFGVGSEFRMRPLQMSYFSRQIARHGIGWVRKGTLMDSTVNGRHVWRRRDSVTRKCSSNHVSQTHPNLEIDHAVSSRYQIVRLVSC